MQCKTTTRCIIYHRLHLLAKYRDLNCIHWIVPAINQVPVRLFCLTELTVQGSTKGGCDLLMVVGDHVDL